MVQSIAVAFKDGYGEVGCSVNFFTDENSQGYDMHSDINLSETILSMTNAFLERTHTLCEKSDRYTAGCITYRFIDFLLHNDLNAAFVQVGIMIAMGNIVVTIEKDNIFECPDGGCHIFDVLTGNEYLTVTRA